MFIFVSLKFGGFVRKFRRDNAVEREGKTSGGLTFLLSLFPAKFKRTNIDI